MNPAVLVVTVWNRTKEARNCRMSIGEEDRLINTGVGVRWVLLLLAHTYAPNRLCERKAQRGGSTQRKQHYPLKVRGGDRCSDRRAPQPTSISTDLASSRWALF